LHLDPRSSLGRGWQNKNAKNKAKHNKLLAQKSNKKKTEKEANKKRLKEVISKAKKQDN